MAESTLHAGYPVNMATPSQAVSWEGFRSIEDKEKYERALIEPAREQSVLGQFVENKTFEPNSGSTMTFRKPLPIDPRMEILPEGVIPAPNSFGMVEYLTTIAEYGDHILYSSKLKDLAIDKLIPVVTNEFSYSFKKFVERKRIGLLKSSKNVWFAGVDAKTPLATLNAYYDALDATSTTGFVLGDLPIVNAFAKRNNVDGGLVAVVPPEVTAILQTTKKDPTYYTWVEINQGQQKDLIYRGETGKMFNTRFVESNAIESFTRSGSDTNYAECYLLGKVNGKWGTTETKLAGKGFPEMIHMQPGSAGSLDPFKQKGSIAWKTYYGGMVIYEEAVIRYIVKLDFPTFTAMDDLNRIGVTKHVKFDSAALKTSSADVNSTAVELGNGRVVKAATTSNKTKVTTPNKDVDGNGFNETYEPVADN